MPTNSVPNPSTAQIGRIMLVAPVCALMLMAGRWIGIENYYAWIDSSRPAPSVTDPSVDQIGASYVANNLVAYAQFDTRFPAKVTLGRSLKPELSEWIPLGIYLIALGALGVVLTRFMPLRVAPMLLHAAPSPERRRLRHSWRRMLLRSMPLIPIACISLVAGFAIFVIDSFYTRLVILSSYSGGLFSTLFDYRPRWKFVTDIEAVSLSISALVIPCAVALFVAGRVLRRGHSLESDLCWRCGYPRDGEFPAHSVNDQVCSECGVRTVPTARRLRARWVTLLGVVLTTTLAMASLYAFDRNSAVFAYHVSGIKPEHYDPDQATQDVVMIEAGVVYRVKMPGEQLWIRFNSATEFGDDIASGTLSFVIESSSKGMQRTGTERFEFVCHRDTLLPEPAPGNLPMPAPGAVQRWQDTLTTPAGSLIEWKLVMRKGLRWANDTGGLYLSPRRATSIKAVAPGDHPPFDEP